MGNLPRVSAEKRSHEATFFFFGLDVFDAVPADVMLEVVRWVVHVKRRALFRDTSLRSPVRHRQCSRCTGQRGTVKAAANTRTDRAWRREPVDTSKHQRIMDAATGKFSTGASSLYCRLIDVRVGPSRALPRGP